MESDPVALTLDGQVLQTLDPGDRVRVVAARQPALFVELPPDNHFDTLRRKLGWGAS